MQAVKSVGAVNEELTKYQRVVNHAYRSMAGSWFRYDTACRI